MLRKKITTIGSWFSKAETRKEVANTGEINNNIMVETGTPLNVYNIELIVLVGILVVLRLIEFLYFVFHLFRKTFKKKYAKDIEHGRN